MEQVVVSKTQGGMKGVTLRKKLSGSMMLQVPELVYKCEIRRGYDFKARWDNSLKR